MLKAVEPSASEDQPWTHEKHLGEEFWTLAHSCDSPPWIWNAGICADAFCGALGIESHEACKRDPEEGVVSWRLLNCFLSANGTLQDTAKRPSATRQHKLKWNTRAWHDCHDSTSNT